MNGSSPFSIQFRILNNLPLTNNTLEGWHRELHAKLRNNGPYIQKFIQKLIDIQLAVRTKIQKFRTGTENLRKMSNKQYYKIYNLKYIVQHFPEKFEQDPDKDHARVQHLDVIAHYL